MGCLELGEERGELTRATVELQGVSESTQVSKKGFVTLRLRSIVRGRHHNYYRPFPAIIIKLKNENLVGLALGLRLHASLRFPAILLTP